MDGPAFAPNFFGVANMKIFSISLIIAGGLSLSTPAVAQIPVTDGAHIAQSALNQAETMAKWAVQYKQMVAQIDQMQKQYDSLNGSRGLGEILNNPALRDYLPSD